MLNDQILQKRESVADILTTTRIQRGFTQEHLAELVGVGVKTIDKIESCKYSPNADQLYAICIALDLPIFLGENKI